MPNSIFYPRRNLLERAAGADHFDRRYRDMPLVKEGIFRFTSNGMYHFGFLLSWAIAIGFDSRAGLLAAVFSHLYIWVHFHATEKPDMKFLYAGTRSARAWPHPAARRSLR